MPPFRFKLLLAVINVKRRRWAAEDAKHCNKVMQRPQPVYGGDVRRRHDHCLLGGRTTPSPRWRYDHCLLGGCTTTSQVAAVLLTQGV